MIDKKSKKDKKISAKKCKKFEKSKRTKKPKKGDTVIIIIKPYYNYECKKGIVERVLTKKKIHTRGHKVKLTDGSIGRTLQII